MMGESVILRLYTHTPPSGRCALLAKQLWQISRKEASLQLAQRLFDNQHTHENPAEVSVADADCLNGLRALCAEFGTVVEVREP